MPLKETSETPSPRSVLILDLLKRQREAENADTVMATAVEALGRHLNVGRVGFIEAVDADTLIFATCWTAGKLAPLSGTLPATSIGAGILAELRAGRATGVADMESDPLAPASVFAESGVRAGIRAPIMRRGDMRAVLYVDQATTRVWTDEEISLVCEVADQTWDAVERARAVAALRESEARSEAILQATSDAIAVSSRDGTVLAANPAYLELYGYDEEEVIGQSFAIIFPEEQRAWAEAQHRVAFDQLNSPQVYESRVRRKDGSERVVEARADFVVENGQRTAMISAIRDITQRHAAEAALRSSEQRLQLALDAAGVGVYSWDPITDRTDADDRLLDMLGLRPGDKFSLAAALQHNIHPDDVPRYREAVEAMLAPDGNGRLEEEVRWIDASGRERWLSFTGQAFFAGEGADRHVVGAIGGVLDVTISKSIERERQAFAASAAHDLKTPLTSLMGQAQLLLRRVRRGNSDLARIEAGLSSIDAASRRMLALIDEVMDAARLDAGEALELQLAPSDMVALAESVVAEAQTSTTRHSIRVGTELPSLVGMWDGVRLSRVLGNVLTNAIKYSPEGGEVMVQVERRDEADRGWAVVRVRDQGVGIPAGDLPHVLKRFRRGGNVAGRIAGTGIGLAGAARIVAQHGGTMDVESVEGQGSTFSVTLPIHPAPSADIEM